MRVLVVSAFVEPHAGGVEHFTAWLRRRLLRSGHDVRVLACEQPGGADADVVLPCLRVGEEMPVTLPTPGVVRRLHREVAWADAVVIQQLGHTLCLLAAAGARLLRRPVRAIFHAAGPPIHTTPLRRVLTNVYDATGARLTARLAPPVAVSPGTSRYAESRYGVASDLMPYPVQPLPARVAPPVPAPGGPLRVVFAARLVAEKAPLDAIAACAAAAEPVGLDLFGDGPLAARVAEAAATRPWVRLHGGVPWSTVTAAQSRAHAFLSTSVEDNVQVGLLEALAMGVPSVATSVGEAPSYLPGPLAAFCVAPGAPGAAAHALDRLRDDYDRWAPLFAENGTRLRAVHAEAAAEAALLAALVRPSRRPTPHGAAT